MTRKSNDNYPTHEGLLVPLLGLEAWDGGPLIRGTVLEPAAGEGQLARPLAEAVSKVYTNDILWGTLTWQCGWCLEEHVFDLTDPDALPILCPFCVLPFNLDDDGTKLLSRTNYNCDFHEDASVLDPWLRKFPANIDWIVTNPPYTAYALEGILEASLAYASHGVAILLRLSALEPVVKRTERGRILKAYADNMRYLMPFSDPRPKYDATKKGTDSVSTAWFVWEKAWSWKQNGMQSPFQFVTGWLK